MKEPQPLSIANIAPDDWNSTPKPVKQLVEALLAQVKLGEVLLADQSRLTQFLDATPIGIAVHDSTGQLAYVNHVGQELLGIDRRSEPQTNLLPEIFQVYRTSSQELYPIEELPSNLALTGKTVQVDDMEIHRAEQVVPMEVWATPIFDDRGQVEYAIAAFQDITERVRSEAERHRIDQALAASEHCYRQVVQTQSDFILRSLPDTTITFANDAMCRALGQSLEQVIGQKWSDFAFGEDLPIILQQIAALTPNHSSFFAENRDRRADDQVGWTQWLNQGIFNQHGHLVELQSVGRDITALKHTEAALRESEAELKLITEAIPAAIIRVDKDRRYRFVNSTYEAWLNLKREDILGRHVQEVIGERAYEAICSDLDRVLRGKIVKGEAKVQQWSGVIREITYTLVPDRDQLAQVQGYYALITDITDRRRTEVALRESEERFRIFMDHSPVAAWITDPNGRMEYTSQTYSRMFQVPSDLIGKTVFDLYPSAIAQIYLDNIQTVAHSGQVIEAIEPGIRADGSPGEFLIYKFRLPQAEGRRLVGGVALDVTERKQAQIALEKSEQRFRNLFESIPKIAIQGYNRQRQVIYWNDASEQLYGYSKTEALGRQLEDLIIPPEMRSVVITAVQNWLTKNQPIPASELSLRHQDGSRVEVYSSHTMLTNPDGEPEMYCVDIDLSDRNQAEAALRESETTNRAIISAFPDLLLRVNRDGTCHEFIPPTDVPSRTFLPIQHHLVEVLPPDILQHFIQRMADALATGGLQVWEHQILKYDRLCDEEVRLVPCGIDECLVVVRDITDRKRAEALLYQSEQALRQRVDQEQTLRRVLQAIRKSLKLDLIFRTATAEVAELVQADRTAVVQYLPEHQCWKHVSEYRKSLDIPNTLGTEIPDQDNPLAEQLKQFKVVRIDNSEVIEDEINQEFAQILPGSWLLVPLIVDQKLWGSFSMIRFQSTTPWTEEEANLVQTIADQLAIAIQQAQAFERAQTEIAERQQAEADLRSALSEKEVLLKEIHHRVKNNLQIVSGLLQLQAQSLQDSPAIHALRESQNRVESMSLIHKKLYIASDLEQIDAADYIQSLATSLLTTYKVSPGAIALQVDVEPVILSLDQGIPCGLIINELVSNALKYAFPTNQPGEIRIQLRQIDHELELTIQDNGVGLPDHLDLNHIPSLGLSLVYALSTEQLEGTLTVDRSRRTTFTIKFPSAS